MQLIRLACHAMATRFELALAGGDEARLRAAGEEALATIQRLEAQLSFYRPRSDIGRINAAGGERPVRVAAEVFRLLQRAQELHALTGGAFDISVAPLLRCWGFTGGPGRIPTPGELADARAAVGMDLLELDPVAGTVRLHHPHAAIDLGAIGKGYALEQAAQVLRELGVDSALLHGGTSSVQAIGQAPAGGGWPVALEYPGDAEAGRTLAVIELRDQALSVSAGWGKSFRAGDTLYGHVLDPRLGRPADAALLAAVVGDAGADADALATALLVLGSGGQSRLTAYRTLVLERGSDNESEPYRVSSHGIEARAFRAGEPRAPQLLTA